MSYLLNTARNEKDSIVISQKLYVMKTQKFVFPRCNKKSNDVALLKTARRLQWSSELRPACLPKFLSEDFSGSLATVAGWGFTDENRNEGNITHIDNMIFIMYKFV